MLKAVGLDITSAADRTLLNSPISSAAVVARGFKAPYAGFPVTATLAQSLRPFPQFNTGLAPLGCRASRCLPSTSIATATIRTPGRGGRTARRS